MLFETIYSGCAILGIMSPNCVIEGLFSIYFKTVQNGKDLECETLIPDVDDFIFMMWKAWIHYLLSCRDPHLMGFNLDKLGRPFWMKLGFSYWHLYRVVLKPAKAITLYGWYNSQMAKFDRCTRHCAILYVHSLSICIVYLAGKKSISIAQQL